MTTQVKTCRNPECSESNPQPLLRFYKNKNSKDGLTSQCKTCAKFQALRWREKNRDKDREKARRYRLNNPEKINKRNRLYRRKKGIQARKKTRSPETKNGKRQCARCQEWKPTARFSLDCSKTDGLTSYCKLCLSRNKEYFLERRLNQKLRQQGLRKCSKCKIIKSITDFYLGDGYDHGYRRQCIRCANQATLNRHKKTPELVRAARHRRRARKLQAGGDYTSEEWEALLEYYEHRCLKCGVASKDTKLGKLSVDHIKALSEGGRNDIANLQPLCLHCNIRKGVRTKDYRSSIPDWILTKN